MQLSVGLAAVKLRACLNSEVGLDLSAQKNDETQVWDKKKKKKNGLGVCV